MQGGWLWCPERPEGRFFFSTATLKHSKRTGAEWRVKTQNLITAFDRFTESPKIQLGYFFVNLLLQILTDDIVMVLLTDFHAIQSQEGNTAGVHIRPSHLPSGIFEDWTPSAPHGLVLNHELQVSCHGVKPEKASAIAFRDHLHCHPNWWDNGLDDAAATSSQIRAQSAQSHSFWTVSHQVKAKANHRG